MGYLHHFNVVTVRKESVSLATIPVGAVIDPRKFTQEYLDDIDAARRVRPKQAGQPLPMSVDGSVDTEYAVEITNPAKRSLEVTWCRKPTPVGRSRRIMLTPRSSRGRPPPSNSASAARRLR